MGPICTVLVPVEAKPVPRRTISLIVFGESRTESGTRAATTGAPETVPPPVADAGVEGRGAGVEDAGGRNGQQAEGWD